MRKPIMLVLHGAIIATLMNTNAGWAEGNGCSSAIPDCALQTQSEIGYSGLQTKGWAYHCTGARPYFWGSNYAGVSDSYSFGNTCFSVTENGFAETDAGKFDATITNWCLKHEDFIVSI